MPGKVSLRLHYRLRRGGGTKSFGFPGLKSQAEGTIHTRTLSQSVPRMFEEQ